MFTLLSTPRSLHSALSFLAVTGPRPRSNTPHFSLILLILTGALKWSTVLRGLCRACPPGPGLPAWAGPARQTFGGLPGEAYKTWSPR